MKSDYTAIRNILSRQGDSNKGILEAFLADQIQETINRIQTDLKMEIETTKVISALIDVCSEYQRRDRHIRKIPSRFDREKC